jgi:hypothetical protein
MKSPTNRVLPRNPTHRQASAPPTLRTAAPPTKAKRKARGGAVVLAGKPSDGSRRERVINSRASRDNKALSVPLHPSVVHIDALPPGVKVALNRLRNFQTAIEKHFGPVSITPEAERAAAEHLAKLHDSGPICIGCGCDELHACDNGLGQGCHWYAQNRETGIGICSVCIGEGKARQRVWRAYRRLQRLIRVLTTSIHQAAA